MMLEGANSKLGVSKHVSKARWQELGDIYLID